VFIKDNIREAEFIIFLRKTLNTIKKVFPVAQLGFKNFWIMLKK